MSKKLKLTVVPDREDMKKGGVYKISNSINHFSYIGSAVNFSNRLAGHLHDCKRGRGNRHLTKFIEDFGKENLIFEILEIITEKSLLKERENFWMQKSKFSDLWNCAPKADSNLGVKMPEYHGEAIRKRMMGNTLTKGVTVKKEVIKKISDFWKNNPERLQQMKDKNRESQKKVPRKDWSKGNIYNVYLNKELIDTVDGLDNVRLKYNIAYVMASKLSTGKREEYKGYSLEKIGSFFITDKEHKREYISGKTIITKL